MITVGILGIAVDIPLLLPVAVKTAATSVILPHIHPSGNLKSSFQDIELIKKINEACKLLDIKL